MRSTRTILPACLLLGAGLGLAGGALAQLDRPLDEDVAGPGAAVHVSAPYVFAPVICAPVAETAPGPSAGNLSEGDLSGAPAPAAAAMPAETPAPEAVALLAAAASAADGADWIPVGSEVLAQARGGFDLGGGLVMSLGLERSVSINGNIVSSASFSIPDVSRLGSAQAALADAALGTLSLLQNGAGNSFLPGPLTQAGAGTVIQNSLNDQVLRTQTVINTSVNSAELLKNINFQDSLRTALNNAVGAK